MALSVPSPDDHPTTLADWLELTALESRSGKSFFADLSSALELDQDFDEEDIGDRDAAMEEVIARAAEEIDQRRRCLSSSYPFSVSDGGGRLQLDPTISLGGYVYLFCLVISHATRSPILREGQLPDSSNSARDLFQICATLCAAGVCRGPAISFGSPRADHSPFMVKLRDIYESLGEGKIRSQPLPGQPVSPKDDGIDVIAWRDTPNGLPGKSIYLLGQAASGRNWESKTVKQDIEVFHDTWFEVQPTSTPTPAMFIPFCLEEPQARTGEFTPQERLHSRMERLTRRFGILFYRYRLPRLAAESRQLALEGVEPIEGLDRAHLLQDWVQSFRKKLMLEP